MEHVYASIDIGSDSIKLVVCDLYQNHLNLLAATSIPSRGIKKGLIVNPELVKKSILLAFKDVEAMLGISIKKVIANVPNHMAEYKIIKGECDVPGDLITSRDMINSYKAGIRSNLMPNEEFVTVVPIDFKINGKTVMKDPKGFPGKKLMGRAMMVTTPKKNVYSVASILESLGIEIVDISVGSIGDINCFKNDNFDKGISAVINIGADITTVSLYNKSIPVSTKIIGAGGRDIDKDLAYMYKIDMEEARKIKENFALAHTRNADKFDVYETMNEDNVKIKINQSAASEVVMSRINEILTLAKNELNDFSQKLENASSQIKQNEHTLSSFKDTLDIKESQISTKETELNNQTQELETKKPAMEEKLKFLLIPPDPLEEKNIIMEIRGGTGGDEASLFAADLFRMYTRYAETKGWKYEIMDLSETEVGGYKEISFSLSGKNVYGHLRWEGGVHRVQRVPETEAQGRIHTSAVTVAVLPEAEETEIEIRQEDLRIDVMRAGGPGGQCVNTTDSAVRITHLPTGLVVIQQDEKSQIKYKSKALRVLRARLFDLEESKKQAERSAARRNMVGSGDRSERIRTYNFPQNRVTDHRINLTLYKLDQFMQGNLDEMLDALNISAKEEALKAAIPAGDA